MMRETIHFAIGSSTLGDFVIATSDKGLVALEFISRRSVAEATLRTKLPGAELIEGPEFDPAIPLELRGTPFELEIWSMLRALPPGETTSYGALAAKPGTRDARLQAHQCAVD
jgi:AraC family transcriptional regulator of adaptative response/methylated-DNA-[protein]-cysteine methyltransferase